MKLTSIGILRWCGEKTPVLFGMAAELSNFGFFQRGTVKEMITFVSRTIVQRTQLGQRQTVKHEEYYCHVHVKDNGLAAIVFADKEYPVPAAFSVINKVLDEFVAQEGNKWEAAQEDTTTAQAIVDAAILKYQVRHGVAPRRSDEGGGRNAAARAAHGVVCAAPRRERNAAAPTLCSFETSFTGSWSTMPQHCHSRAAGNNRFPLLSTSTAAITNVLLTPPLPLPFDPGHNCRRRHRITRRLTRSPRSSGTWTRPRSSCTRRSTACCGAVRSWTP